MLKEAIATGATVEEAHRNACAQLGVDPVDAEFEILELPEKKVFGLFGGSPAKVRAFLRETPVSVATEYLTKVLHAMGLSDVQIEAKENENNAELVLSGEGVGFIIGHRGDTLDALQYLTSLVANHVEESYYRITLDVGNYREKRQETLENLGKKMASRAVRTGRNLPLEPMNPYERRIIHTAVQTVEGAKSWSEGEDLSRHVVIGPVDGPRPQPKPERKGGYRGDRKPGGDRRGNDRRPGGYRNDRGGNRPPRRDGGNPPPPRTGSRPKTPAAPPKPRVLDNVSTPYGRIEKKD